MASRPRKKCAFFNKGLGLQDLESFLIEDCQQTTRVKQDGSTGDQSSKDISKGHNQVKDVELIDSDCNSCSTVNVGNTAYPSSAKLSVHTNSEPTNFNGIISGSVAALEDTEHSFATNQTTFNNKGSHLRTSPVNDAAFLNSCTAEKKVYTQLLTVQTDQFEVFEPYAGSPSPSKHKVQDVSGIGNITALLPGPDKRVTHSYDAVKDGSSDQSNVQHPPPRPYTRRPSHPYLPYPISSPSEQCLASHVNTTRGVWPSHLQKNSSSWVSSNSVVVQRFPTHKQQRSCTEPSSTIMSEHGAVLNGSISATEFNRTTKQYQQPLGNCNHGNLEVPLSKSNRAFHASLQYGEGVHTSPHKSTISYQRCEQSYLPSAAAAAAANSPTSHYHRRLYTSYSNNNLRNGSGIGDAVGVDFISNSSALCDRGASSQGSSSVDAMGRSAFMRVMPQRGYSHHQPAIVAPVHYHTGEPSSPVLHHKTSNSTVNISSCSDDSNPAFSSGNPTERKRVQSCKLCRNHGVETPIKGHKYMCPYKKCPCKNCSITLKSRHFVKEQLKITRKQNVSASQHLSDCEEQLNEPTRPSVSGVPFTMKEDMLKDMEKLNNMKLFKEIDRICRPHSFAQDSESTRPGS